MADRRMFRARLSVPSALLVGVALLGVACSNGDTEMSSPATETATETGPATATVATTPSVEVPPDAAWPELGTASVITDDLNVRAGPALEYLIVGRLQPDDEIPVSGRATDGRWLALPGIGWVAYDESWIELPMPLEELPLISPDDAGFEFVGPLQSEDASVDIPVVDVVVSAVAEGDQAALVDLASAPTRDADGEGQDGAGQNGEGQDGSAGESDDEQLTPPNSACQDEVRPASELEAHLDEFFASEIGAAGPLRLYAVIGSPGSEDVDAEFSVVFAFEGGEARQLWLTPTGGIAWFNLGCDAMTPGDLLRIDPGREHFFWLRPVTPEPLDPVE